MRNLLVTAPPMVYFVMSYVEKSNIKIQCDRWEEFIFTKPMASK